MKKLLLIFALSISSLQCVSYVSYRESLDSLVFQGNKALVAYDKKYNAMYPIHGFDHQSACGFSRVVFYIIDDYAKLIPYNAQEHGELLLTNKENAILKASVDDGRASYVRTAFARENEELEQPKNLNDIKTYYLEENGNFNEIPTQVMEKYPSNNKAITGFLALVACYIYLTEYARCS